MEPQSTPLPKIERRSFIKVAVAVGVGSTAARAIAQHTSKGVDQSDTVSGLPRIKDPGELRGEMLYRVLGKTGERVSAIGLGGSHIAKPAVPASESIRLIQEAIDRGIT
ncbi:MAG: aldo/keto reductase, partial [Verrucomicrobia bacterium]|nr:aldo/keto reductase [Verrucomicrobiota bacterium]